ncbi:MAG: hypothetical protein OES32_03040 [Acidobacteriota bacterium]|nr:hypothetical protein [Acidobacteriota bacterium]
MTSELLLFSLIALAVGAWLVVRQQNFRLRQMRHRERLATLEKGLQLEPGNDPEGDEEMSNVADQWKDPATYVNWFQLTALGLACLMTFGGVGLLVAFIIVEDPEMQKLWSLGLIPIMTGFGLFLFWILSTKILKKQRTDN